MNRSLLLLLAAALFMESLDSSIIATSLPAIAADVNTSPLSLKLAFTSYLVAIAVFIPISGWVADRFGMRRVFSIAIGIFIAGSIACAVSGSLLEFVFARFIQGAGASMMTPVGRLIMVRSTTKDQLVNAILWVTIPGLVGPILGPPLGGLITTYISWHWIFLINVPVGLIGIFAATRLIPDYDRDKDLRFDAKGFLLIAVATSGIVFGLSVVSLPALPIWYGIIISLTGALCAWLYCRHEARCEQPVLRFAAFKNAIFRNTIHGTNLFRIGYGAVPFLLPVMFQLVFGMSALASGLLTASTAMGIIATKVVARPLLKRYGVRKIMIGSALAASVMIAVNAIFTPSTPAWLIISILLIAGGARSMLYTTSGALTLSEVPPSETSQAAAIASASQQISTAIGVAVGATVLEISTLMSGGTLSLQGFVHAFIVMAALATCSLFFFARLPQSTGNEIAGRPS